MSDTAFSPDLSLTPSQEGLLRTALSSNAANSNPGKPAAGGSSQERLHSGPKQQSNGSMALSASTYTSPTQQTPGSGHLGSHDESPFLDYDNLDDGNFDWDNGGDQLFGDLPGTDLNDENEHHDKRKASNDEGVDEEGSSKRREGDDKSAKKPAQKPGRKPLTGEPTTKRKAQNRAAQRAFRERKERHLKDLETKVEDLEKASENANHENGRLRATVDKLQTELKEYRKRISLNVSGAGHSPPQSATSTRGYNNSADEFSFAFPKFGDLPGSYLNNGSMVKTTSPAQNGQRSASSGNTRIPDALRKTSSSSTHAVSPTNLNSTAIPSNNSVPYQAPANGLSGNRNDGLAGLFDPAILEYASRSNSADYMSHPSGETVSTNGTVKKDSFASTNSQSQVPNVRHASTTSFTGSPVSLMSQALDSSCGTTPESSAESPDNRKGSDGVMNTFNEKANGQNMTGATSKLVKSPATDIHGFDWMAQQNGGQFDPVLFGDYRDPQDNILNSFGDYFNDAFPLNDFSSPYNTADITSQLPRRDFMKEIDVQRDGSPKTMAPDEENKQYLTCEKLWDRVKNSDIAQAGEAEMDDLCSQLKSKAKCSGKGAVIHEKDVNEILGPAPAEQTDFMKMFS